MKGVFSLVVLVSAVAAAHVAPPTRIVGGQPTTIERYPSTAQVESRGVFSGIWSQSCACAILTSRAMLSAAHCFAGLTFAIENRRIRAGTTQRNTGGQLSNCQRAVNHPQYNLEIIRDYDVTIVWVENPLEWNPVVQPATIAAPGSYLYADLPVTTAGWGTLYSGGPQPNDLHHVTKNIIDWEVCRERYEYLTSITPGGNYPVTRNMFCAGVLDVGGKDACQGDSGGPVYVVGAEPRDHIVVGVVSWGWGCANETYPGLNANTANDEIGRWIISTVEAN